VLALALAACAATAATTVAQPARTAQNGGADAERKSDRGAANLEQLVTDLGSEDFEKREAATIALALNQDLPLSTIEAFLSRPGLSPEQRARLLVAAREAFVRSPRAAMGVEFRLEETERAIIARAIDGFPSKMVVKEGDEIVEINGVPAANGLGRSIFRPIIISRDPGDVLHLKVRRRVEATGEVAVVPLEVPLGRYDDLRGNGNLFNRAADLVASWRVRSAPYMAQPGTGGQPGAAAIAPGIPAEVWERGEGQPRRGRGSPTRGDALSAGGVTWGSLPPARDAAMGAKDPDVFLPFERLGDPNIGPNGQVILPVRPGARILPATEAGGMDARLFELDRLVLERDMLELRALEQGAIADDAGKPAEERDRARVSRDLYTKQVESLKRRIDALNRAVPRVR
jgi:hypothetical protein